MTFKPIGLLKKAHLLRCTRRVSFNVLFKYISVAAPHAPRVWTFLNNPFFLLMIILFGAFYVRYEGIFYGVPYFFHPDEVRIVLDTLSMGHRHSFLPERPDYALLFRYFLLCLYGMVYLGGYVWGIFKEPLDFAFQFMTDPSFIFVISRFISVLLGVGCSVLAFLIGKRFFSVTTGLLSALFIALEIQLVQHSHYILYSMATSFFVLLSFYFLLALLDKPSKKNFLKAGVFIGLSISVQNQTVFILPSFLAALFFIYFRKKGHSEHPERSEGTRGISNILLALGSIAFFGLLGNFYWIFDFQKVWLKTSELMGVTQVGFSSQAPYSYTMVSMVWWFIREVIYQDKILGVFFLLGILWALKSHTSRDILFLVYLFVNLFVFSSWAFRSLHELLPALPILAILGARFFFCLERYFRQ